MSAESDLQTALDNIKSALPAVADRITALVGTITAGQVMTQAQLDSLTAEASDIATQLTALGTPGPTGRKR